MKTLICPLSPERIDGNVARTTGFFMALLIALSLAAGSPIPAGLAAIDYAIRAFTPYPLGPVSWLARQSNRALDVDAHTINRAPKIFAARVGFLFALATTCLLLPTGAGLSAFIVGGTLLLFALLESLADLCMGCIVYTYLILPVFGPANEAN